MSYRYYTYKMDWGYVTIDSQTEEEPQGYLDKFPVTTAEANAIEEGADLYDENGELIIGKIV